MRVEYSRRALSDIRDLAAYYASSDAPSVGEAVAARIQEVVMRLSQAPQSGRPVAERPGVRVVPLLRFRWNIFYAVRGDSLRIVHIRHTSRRPWAGG
jgi:plasmid stabilization system protein ParE